MFGASEKLVAFVKEREGFKTKAYLCPAGIWTLGYGHTKGVAKDMTCNAAQADAWLREDISGAIKDVYTLYEPKTQGECDALTDFVYNLGCSKLKSSTLLKFIKAGRPADDIQSEFMRWRFATVSKKDPKTGEITRKKVELGGLKVRCEWRAKRWVEWD